MGRPGLRPDPSPQSTGLGGTGEIGYTVVGSDGKPLGGGAEITATREAEDQAPADLVRRALGFGGGRR